MLFSSLLTRFTHGTHPSSLPACLTQLFSHLHSFPLSSCCFCIPPSPKALHSPRHRDRSHAFDCGPPAHLTSAHHRPPCAPPPSFTNDSSQPPNPQSSCTQRSPLSPPSLLSSHLSCRLPPRSKPGQFTAKTKCYHLCIFLHYYFFVTPFDSMRDATLEDRRQCLFACNTVGAERHSCHCIDCFLQLCQFLIDTQNTLPALENILIALIDVSIHCKHPILSS